MRLGLYCLAFLTGLNLYGADAVNCTSPNGNNIIAFKLVDGVPQYDATFNGRAVIRDSALGLNVTEKPFAKFEIKDTEKDSHEST